MISAPEGDPPLPSLRAPRHPDLGNTYPRLSNPAPSDEPERLTIKLLASHRSLQAERMYDFPMIPPISRALPSRSLRYRRGWMLASVEHARVRASLLVSRLSRAKPIGKRQTLIRGVELVMARSS